MEGLLGGLKQQGWGWGADRDFSSGPRPRESAQRSTREGIRWDSKRASSESLVPVPRLHGCWGRQWLALNLPAANSVKDWPRRLRDIHSSVRSQVWPQGGRWDRMHSDCEEVLASKGTPVTM